MPDRRRAVSRHLDRQLPAGDDALAGNKIPNYLAVEGRFLSQPFSTCGGRRGTLDDTIDVSYTVLAAGLSGTVVTDGIDADADPATPASLTDFPFLNAPR